MIYSRIQYCICCDLCAKTIVSNAASEQIAKETAERKGWEFDKADSGYEISICPECRL